MHRFVSPSLTQLASATALLGALLLVPSAAHAQDDVTLTMARERFKEGVAYFDKKDFAKARVAFLQAYALKKHPAVLLNLAQSELRSGHEADAAKHFAQYLRDYKDATDAERQGAETGLTAAKALVAEVAVDVDATGAEVYVDGDLEGQAPLPGPVFLAPGGHELYAKKEGKGAKIQVSAVAGQSSSVALKLAAVGRTTPSGGATPAPASGDGEAAPPSEVEPERDRESFFPWLAHKPAGIVGVGLFGVGAIGAIAFGVGSKSAYDAADSVADGIKTEAVNVDKKPDSTGVCVNPSEWLGKVYSDPMVVSDRAGQYKKNCDKYTSNVNSGDTFKTLAFVSAGVAVAAGAATIIYYFVDSSPSSNESARRNKSQRRITLFPVHQPGFSGGIVAGTF